MACHFLLQEIFPTQGPSLQATWGVYTWGFQKLGSGSTPKSGLPGSCPLTLTEPASWTLLPFVIPGHWHGHTGLRSRVNTHTVLGRDKSITNTKETAGIVVCLFGINWRWETSSSYCEEICFPFLKAVFQVWVLSGLSFPLRILISLKTPLCHNYCAWIVIRQTNQAMCNETEQPSEAWHVFLQQVSSL